METFRCHGNSGSWSEDKDDYDVGWQPVLNSSAVVSGWSYDTTSSRYNLYLSGSII